ncbi:MAG: chromate transporter [Treponema sp.]|jgi:chromate transporter|nr:chromate transporter [Treponema sp.]
MSVFLLYFEFVSIGLFSIGGGLATLPFIYRLAGKYAWLDAANIPDMFAVAQLIPGAIGVNLGAYTGLRAAGPAGAYMAALGLITGPVAIIIIIARFYERFKKNCIVQSVFDGLRPAAAGLLAFAGYGILKRALCLPNTAGAQPIFKPCECILFVIFYFLLITLKKMPVVFFIAMGAAAGIMLKLR